MSFTNNFYFDEEKVNNDNRRRVTKHIIHVNQTIMRRYTTITTVSEITFSI